MFFVFKFSVLRIGECVWKMERAIKEPKISVWQFLGNTSFILKTTKNSFSKWKNKIFASEQAIRAASHAVLRPLLYGS